MSSTDIESIVRAVVAELRAQGVTGSDAEPGNGRATSTQIGGEVVIDLPDPTEPEPRYRPGVVAPHDPEGLTNLVASTTARLGVGRAGPRPRTSTMLLFQADHGVTQDAIYGVVDEEVKERFDLFTVPTLVGDREEYLLRPDLGRRLSDETKQTIRERCTSNPQVQIVVSDGLSAAAINNNLEAILPVLTQGLQNAGVTVGTPFFIENGRVGVINDVGDTLGADVVVMLIGERPGLGIADAMSAYMGFRPAPGKTDADRDLICMITTHGGTNPLEAGAYVVDFVRKMLEHQASGGELRRRTSDGA
jgi:ethanolamine ammonia-lyase small subunit